MKVRITRQLEVETEIEVPQELAEKAAEEGENKVLAWAEGVIGELKPFMWSQTAVSTRVEIL